MSSLNTVATPSLEQAKYYLDSLDLTYIIDCMCSANYSLPRWTKQDAEHCCRLYKNFLFLIKSNKDEALVPSRLIDEFWHNHILYTKNYTEDCLHIFGHYLHHEPASPNDNPQQLIEDFTKTKDLYFAAFQKSMV